MTQHDGTSNMHPADALGLALMRATGVLSALTACQDTARGTFALEGQFLVQAIAAVEGFVNDARNAYFDLLTANALSTVTTKGEVARRKPEPTDYREEQAIFATEEPQVLAPLPDIYAFRKSDLASQPETSRKNVTENFAESYDEFLRKLTAAEVFASERGLSGGEPNSPLLPLLKSLREDLQRFRAA